MYTKDNVIVGKAIIQAYQLEQIQRWVGCWIDPDLLDDEAIRRLLIKHEPHLFVRYNISTKKGIQKDQYAINWVLIVGASSIFAKQGLEDAIKDERGQF